LNYLKNILPNVITLLNLSLGIIAILLTINNSNNNKETVNALIYACLVIMVAAVTDRLDGKIARMLGTTSELGKQLDSLSDLISFGVAPIIISWKICLMDFNIFGYLLAILFPIAGAYRLARFNTSEFSNVFTGMPITIAGAFLAIANLFNCISLINNRYTNLNSIITVILIIILSFLMVSTFKIKKI